MFDMGRKLKNITDLALCNNTIFTQVNTTRHNQRPSLNLILTLTNFKRLDFTKTGFSNY